MMWDSVLWNLLAVNIPQILGQSLKKKSFKNYNWYTKRREKNWITLKAQLKFKKAEKSKKKKKTEKDKRKTVISK